MTEERLYDLYEESQAVKAKEIIEVMKQAVNEALDEAARIAMHNMLPKTSEEITNLKVK